MFQHTAARRRLVWHESNQRRFVAFQHTAARRRLAIGYNARLNGDNVSTHSRPKAAGFPFPLKGHVVRFQHTAARRRLVRSKQRAQPTLAFQHTAARRRLANMPHTKWLKLLVSTHSRPKAAGTRFFCVSTTNGFQHTAARRRLDSNAKKSKIQKLVSTHSRPKAAGFACFRFAA